MRASGKAIRWVVAGAAGAALIAGLAAPYWNLDRFARQIQASLEKELQRRVTVGRVHLELLGGPGFSVDDVVIQDDPRVGREPLAYVTALEARIALRSLWTGRLEFASLRLVEPSVNLTRSSGGVWNFEDLVGRTLKVTPGAGRQPAIQVRRGRINLKFGEVKSAFYFTNADVDIAPPAGGEAAWGLRFSGEPARTDRPARGLGRIAGRGRFQPGGRLELTVELERSYLEEISALLAGRDLGLRGRVTSRVQAAGPVSALEISGRAQLRDFRRWDLMPPLGGDWDFSYRGRLDLLSQRLSVEATPQGALALTVRLRLFDYLSQPRWGVLAGFENLPLEATPGLLRVMGIEVPEGLKLAGPASGAAGYSAGGGLHGMLVAREASLGAPGGAEWRCARAPVILDGEQLRLGPLRLERSDNASLTLEGTYRWEGPALTMRISTESMAIAGQGERGLLPGLAPVPLLSLCRSGSWRGALRYESKGSDSRQWTGRLELRDAEMAVPGLASPLRVAQARIRLGNEEAAIEGMRASLGETTVEAEYHYRQKGAWPEQFRVSAGAMDAAELERVLGPVLDRRRGLLARALRLGRPAAPEWLRRRRAEGEFAIASLEMGGVPVAGPVRGRLRWDGIEVEIMGLEARLAEAKLAGRLEVDLKGATPVYRLVGALGPLSWSGGRWDAEGLLETAGLGADLLENLRAEGSFLGRSVGFGPEQGFESVAGRFSLGFVRGTPRLKIEALEGTEGEEIYRGECQTLADGRVRVEFSGPQKQVRLAGTLWPPKLEPAGGR